MPEVECPNCHTKNNFVYLPVPERCPTYRKTLLVVMDEQKWRVVSIEEQVGTEFATIIPSVQGASFSGSVTGSQIFSSVKTCAQCSRPLVLVDAVYCPYCGILI